MRDEAELVNPSPHIEPESKRSDSQRTVVAGKQLITMLKAMTLLVFIAVSLNRANHLPSD